MKNLSAKGDDLERIKALVDFEIFRFDLEAAVPRANRSKGGRHIVHAAPNQRNTIAEKAAIKDGRIPDGWQDKPAKLAQKDRDARWTVKYTKAKPREDGSLPAVDLAIPAFGYKNHVSIDRAYGLIRAWTATSAAAHDGARLEDVLDRSNTSSNVSLGRYCLLLG